jgi:predicted peroxiredoxin
MENANSVVVVLTTGKQDRGTRATLAFGWACAALALGKDVSMYLTMDGTMWAMRGAAASVQVEGFESLDEYVSQFFALGGNMLVCAPCSEYYCSFDRNLVRDKLLPDATVVGLTTVVGKIGTGTSVVSF